MLSPGVQVREQALLEGHIGLQELALEILEFRVLHGVNALEITYEDRVGLARSSMSVWSNFL